MGYKRLKLSNKISLIQETGVAHFMRCNIWHVKGRDFDLVIDTGMGLDPLKQWIMQDTDRPLKALVTHCHFDHAGCLHEFDVRMGHRAESDILASPTNNAVVYAGAWTRIAIVDKQQHPDYSPQTYSIKAAPLTHYLDEGDVIDLGDSVYQILHLPGHSPGSIGLWDKTNKVLFSGDALYNGQLLDSLYHSNKEIYLNTLERIESLGAKVFHGGHEPSFDARRMKQIIAGYRQGRNTLGNIEQWFEESKNNLGDMFADQDWSAATTLTGAL